VKGTLPNSDPFIVMVSTPHVPEGLFEKIEREPDVTCIYKRIFLDYSYGLDKIYTKDEIDKPRYHLHLFFSHMVYTDNTEFTYI
jgi:hypothetical protein